MVSHNDQPRVSLPDFEYSHCGPARAMYIKGPRTRLVATSTSIFSPFTNHQMLAQHTKLVESALPVARRCTCGRFFAPEKYRETYCSPECARTYLHNLGAASTAQRRRKPVPDTTTPKPPPRLDKPLPRVQTIWLNDEPPPLPEKSARHVSLDFQKLPPAQMNQRPSSTSLLLSTSPNVDNAQKHPNRSRFSKPLPRVLTIWQDEEPPSPVPKSARHIPPQDWKAFRAKSTRDMAQPTKPKMAGASDVSGCKPLSMPIVRELRKKTHRSEKTHFVVDADAPPIPSLPKLHVTNPDPPRAPTLPEILVTAPDGQDLLVTEPAAVPKLPPANIRPLNIRKHPVGPRAAESPTGVARPRSLPAECSPIESMYSLYSQYTALENEASRTTIVLNADDGARWHRPRSLSVLDPCPVESTHSDHSQDDRASDCNTHYATNKPRTIEEQLAALLADDCAVESTRVHEALALAWPSRPREIRMCQGSSSREPSSQRSVRSPSKADNTSMSAGPNSALDAYSALGSDRHPEVWEALRGLQDEDELDARERFLNRPTIYLDD
jgi:hypothetical protein